MHVLLYTMQVGFVEQQVIRRRVKKSYTPSSDPNWTAQWSLVSLSHAALQIQTILALLSVLDSQVGVLRVWTWMVTNNDSCCSCTQLNTGQTNGPAGLDLNVEPAWMQGITGSGVVVSFMDDGQIT